MRYVCSLTQCEQGACSHAPHAPHVQSALCRSGCSRHLADLPSECAPRFGTLPRPQTSPTPLHIVLGMIFTTAACPLTSALAPAFYRRHRTKVVFLVRLLAAARCPPPL